MNPAPSERLFLDFAELSSLVRFNLGSRIVILHISEDVGKQFHVNRHDQRLRDLYRSVKNRRVDNSCATNWFVSHVYIAAWLSPIMHRTPAATTPAGPTPTLPPRR
jgi:hypothetical protein